MAIPLLRLNSHLRRVQQCVEHLHRLGIRSLFRSLLSRPPRVVPAHLTNKLRGTVCLTSVGVKCTVTVELSEGSGRCVTTH